jgi:hypothetical protein
LAVFVVTASVSRFPLVVDPVFQAEVLSSGEPGSTDQQRKYRYCAMPPPD